MRLIVLGLLSLLLATPATAQRIATIIANSDYERTGWDLPNPVRDGDLMKSALEKVGFDVVIIRNADEDTMEAALVGHGKRLKSAGKQAVGFFYFAGHGVQSGRYNYLIPTDISAQTEQDVWAQAPRLGLLYDAIEDAGNDTNFIILDACRDNPLPSASRSGQRGLKASGRVRGTLIAYSTAPGTVASDGAGQYSPFAASLARFLPQKGLTAEALFRRVASAVESETEMAQQPWVESGLRGADFCFSGCGAAGSTIVTAEAEAEALNKAYAAGNSNALKTFLRNYPASRSRSLVESRIEELKQPTSTVETKIPTTNAPATNVPGTNAPGGNVGGTNTVVTRPKGDGIYTEPGLWSSTATMFISLTSYGQTASAPPEQQTEQECVLPEDAYNTHEDLIEEMSANAGMACSAFNVMTESQELSMDVTCVGADGVLTGTLEAVVDEVGESAAYEFNITGASVDGQVTMLMSVEGERIGSC